jgi:Transposase DDE domain group 1
MYCPINLPVAGLVTPNDVRPLTKGLRRCQSVPRTETFFPHWGDAGSKWIRRWRGDVKLRAAAAEAGGALSPPPQRAYERIYCACGEMENRIKECQLGLYADRTSCYLWWPNPVGMLLASLAYIPDGAAASRRLPETACRAASGRARSGTWGRYGLPCPDRNVRR